MLLCVSLAGFLKYDTCKCVSMLYRKNAIIFYAYQNNSWMPGLILSTLVSCPTYFQSYDYWHTRRLFRLHEFDLGQCMYWRLV